MYINFNDALSQPLISDSCNASIHVPPSSGQAVSERVRRTRRPLWDTGLVYSRINDRNLVDAVTVRVYRKDAIIVRHKVDSVLKGGGLRSKIIKFTNCSRRNLLFKVRNSDKVLSVMCTLTYPLEFPCDGKIVKKHLANFRKFLVRKGISGVWFFEFQERGAPHIHFLLSGFVDKDVVAKRWFEIVKSGDEKHLRAGTRIELIRRQDGAERYACKYACKNYQKVVPDGFIDVGRFWSSFGRLSTTEKIQIYGTPKEISPFVRVARKKLNSDRKAYGCTKKRDSGVSTFTAFDCAPVLAKLIEPSRMGSFCSSSETAQSERD